MKSLTQLIREVKSLAKYVEREIPRDVSKAWLWTSQNAFLTQTNPSTGKRWSDRYGIAYGKGIKHIGNIEPFLSYSKLHRTGKLLRGLKVRRKSGTRGSAIELYNNVPYAEDHELGKQTNSYTVKKPYVTNGAKGVITGGSIVARPFMNPSKQVLNAPKRLLEGKMKSYGWKR